MVVYHTSPDPITQIKKAGLFNDCLFFADEPYYMTQAASPVVYELEIDDSKVIAAGDLHDEEIIAQIADVLEVSDDAAERMLDGRDNAFEHGGSGEDDWWIQALQGECATKMGYDACEAFDEQGTVYIIPMLGKLDRLNLSDAS